MPLADDVCSYAERLRDVQGETLRARAQAEVSNGRSASGARSSPIIVQERYIADSPKRKKPIDEQSAFEMFVFELFTPYRWKRAATTIFVYLACG